MNNCSYLPCGYTNNILHSEQVIRMATSLWHSIADDHKSLFIISKTKIMQKINVRDLAGKFHAYLNCVKSNNTEWKDKHEDAIESMLENLPSGSGFDAGTKFDWDNSTSERLVFNTAFHHMDEHGGYDGWTQHRITVTASLFFGIKIGISGKDRNGIKEYMHDVFSEIFSY